MKLHLPSGLRRALLTCLATLAAPICSATLGSAAVAFSGAAVVTFLTSAQAVAEVPKGEDGVLTAQGDSSYTASENETVGGIILDDAAASEDPHKQMNSVHTTIQIEGDFTVDGSLGSTGTTAYRTPNEENEGSYDHYLNTSGLTIEGSGTFIIGGDSADYYRGLTLGKGINLHVKEDTNLTYFSIKGENDITIEAGKTLGFALYTADEGDKDENRNTILTGYYFGPLSKIEGDICLYGEGTLDVRQNLFDGGSAGEGNQLVDLYLNDKVTIRFSQYSYGEKYGNSSDWIESKGSVFHELFLGENADVTIQFGSNKSAVTFETKFVLKDEDNKNLTFESLEGGGGAGEYGQVYFKQGAEIDTLRIKGHTIRFSMGADTHIKRIDAENYNAEFLAITGYLINERPRFFIDAEEDWTANISIESAYAIYNPQGEQIQGEQIIKTGEFRVTFTGTRESTMDGLWVQEGELFFLNADHLTVHGIGEFDYETYNTRSDVKVDKGAVLGLGTVFATFVYDLNIEGDLDLSNGVIVEVNTWAEANGGEWTPGHVTLGGLTTIFAEDDDVYGTGVFQSGANIFKLNNSHEYTINVVDDVVKKAYGIDFSGNNLTKLGKGRQVLSNYNTLGNVTLGTANTTGDVTPGGVLELRDDRGRIMGETKGADAAATLLIHRYETAGSQTKITSIAFAKKIAMAGSLGLHQGVNAYLGAQENRIGGLVGDTNEKGEGIGSATTVNYIRLATDDDFDEFDIYEYTTKKDEKGNEYIERGDRWWSAPTAADLTIDVQGEGTRRTHGGMLEFADSITLVKDGAGMQEVTGILANTLIVNEGRFRITGLNEEHNGQRWLGRRVINNIIVDGEKNWTGKGEKSYFEVSVQNANYWTIADSTMTLRNGGIFRAAGRGVDTESESSATTVTSEFYVGKLFVSRTVENAPEGAADGVIKWNTLEDTFAGDDTTNRDNNSHKFVFGLLSSVDQNGVIDSTKDHVLEIEPMMREKESAAQGIVFRTIKDFSGTIKADAGESGNGNYFQIGMDVADVGFATKDGRTGLDTSVIDTVNTGAYAEAEEENGREKVFNTELAVVGSGVYSEVFRKRGDGKLKISGENGLTIGSNGTVGGGVIFMNYAGEIEITSDKDGNKITVGDDVTLLYTTGQNNEHRENSSGEVQKGGVIDYLSVTQLEKLSKNRLYIDLLHLENVEDLLKSELGISLGIQFSDESELETLREKINLRGIDTGEGKTTWELLKGPDVESERNTVYLRVTSDQIYFSSEDFLWDKSWGGVAYFAPNRAEMYDQEFYTGAEMANGFVFQSENVTDFVDNSLVLADSGYKAYSSGEAASQDRMSIRLIGGGAGENEDTTATVIGGKLYKAGNITALTNTAYWELRGNSYISLIDTTKYDGEDYIGEGDAEHLHFHLLVGGSSCVANVGDNSTMGDKTVEAVGGFKGNSHIQMDGGQVDYIVGGNHVNNSAFIFRGRAFISVLSGEVYGGIVGGSTLTKGSVNKYTQAFDGSTHIFIYTPLTNKKNGDTPEISDGTKSADGVANAQFTAIVGGNAWIDLPATVVEGEDISLRPTFRGNSNIVIDLSGVQEEATFEKDLVGGNYTVYHGDNLLDEAGRRGTEYISNGLTSYVMVTANADHAFTGDINGASRRASAGKGETYYTGNVQVRLRGGKYQKTVVGGLWLDASATGDHQARLIGNTEVNAGVNGPETATYWRLIGGSYSLAGGDDATEDYEGNSTVYLWGGTVSEEGAITGVEKNEDLGQLQLRVPMIVGGNLYRNNSGSELMRKGNTAVYLYGGTLDGVHVVGGDQANSSTDSSSSGKTSAIIAGTSRIHVTTVDAGGNPFTDALTEQAASSVSITGLLVGGSYMTDAGANGSVSVNSTEILLRGSKDAEVTIAYESDPLHTHSGTQIAIVGGNMLVAQKTTGGDHTLTVTESTTIDIHSHVDITGNVVGGSYTNGTEEGVNTIGIKNQTVSIGIHGGTIKGHVYGGHYSSNATESPDVLAIGDITITMDAASAPKGGYVTGNIVGGGYRKTTNDLTGSSTQGAIEINLEAGTLEGNVYAAGFNDGIYSDSTGSEVHTQTESTHVTVESGFTFVKGVADAGLADGDLLISGGYGRVDEKVARGTIEKFAKLTFWGSNESINNWADGAVTLRNVNVVEVWGAGAKIEVDGDLYVLRQKEKQEENFITKNGEGMLSVSRINIWGSNDAAQSAVGYRGQIVVNDGYIKLTGASLPSEAALLANEPMGVADAPAYRQDLSGGLTVNLATALQRHYNSKDNAYLQAHDLKADGLGELYVNTEYGKAKVRFTFGADDATYSTLKNERTSEAPTLTKLHYGKYYLATGLADEITRANKGEYFDYADAVKELQAKIDDWAQGNDQYKYYVADVQIIDHSLVLRVRDDREKFGWWWGCNADSEDALMDGYDTERELEILHGEKVDDGTTWNDASSANWTQHGTQDMRYVAGAGDPFTNGNDDAWNLTPRGQNLHFGAGGDGTEVTLVNDTGKKNVAPRSVWVQDAQYSFTGAADAVLSIGSDTEANVDESDLMFDRAGNPNTVDMLLAAGELRVGGDYWDTEDKTAYQNPENAAEAELALGVQVSDMAVASLYKGGALVLDHEKALVKGGDGATQIVFEGGLLGYTANSASLGDLSAQVSAASSGKIRIRVGNTKQGIYHDDELIKQDIPITWGNLTETELTNGVKLALANGFEKSGADDFTLLWASNAAPAAAYSGSIDVLEGELVYHHETLTTAHTAALSGKVSVANGTKLTFLETGAAAGTLSVAGAISGAGHVVIGAGAGDYRTAAAEHTPYSLSGDNSDFAGVLELLGASAAAVADLAGMNAAAALGGENTTLRLAGRHLYFTEGAAKTIAVKSVQIVDGSVNYVGGFRDDEANKSITLKGTLEWTDAKGQTAKAAKSGVLANAWGSDGAGFHHTYDGSSLHALGEVVILAGAGATKSAASTYSVAGVPGSSDSVWILQDSSGATTEIKAHLGGAGSFIFNYGAHISLTGYVGVAADGTTTTEEDQLTSIANAQAGKGNIVMILDGKQSDWWSGAVDAADCTTDLTKVAGHNIATGSISGGFMLGDKEHYGTWSGTVLNGEEETALTLVNGVLKNALSKAADNRAQLNVATEQLTSTTGTKVDVGGTDGSMFDEITITAGSQMLGAAGEITVDGEHTKVSLTLTKDNMANAPEGPGRYLIVSKDKNAGASMKVTDADDFTLNIDNTAFRELLRASMSKAGVDVYLHIMGNGSLEIADATTRETLLSRLHGTNTDLLDMLEWQVKEGVQTPGDIILTYTGEILQPEWYPHEVYLVIDEDDWAGAYTDPHNVTEYGRMSSHFKATFIDTGKTLTVTLSGSPDDVTDDMLSDPTYPQEVVGDHAIGIAKDKAAHGALVNNLVGMEGAAFDISNAAPKQGRVNIVLNNMKFRTTAEPGTEDGIYQGDDFAEKGIYGLDTEYWGELNGGEGVDLRKTGWGRLTIGSAMGAGHVQLADGTLTIDQGSMTLQGDGNKLAKLTFAYDSAENAAMGEERTLWLKNGTSTIGSILEKNDKAAAGRAGADIAMDGALLVLTGESQLADSSIAGVTDKRVVSRLSEVQLAKEAVLALTGTDKAQLSNVGLILDADGAVDVGSNALNSVRGIDGAGSLAGSGATLAVTDNLVDANARTYAFSGALSGEGNAIIVKEDAKLLLLNAIGGDGWDVTNRGTLILDVSGSPNNEDHLTHLGDLTLGSGSTTTLRVNTDLKSRELPTISVEHIIAEEGASFVLETTGLQKLRTENHVRGPRYGVAFVRAEDQNRTELSIHEPGANMTFTGKGAAMWRSDIVDAYIESGVLWLQMEEIKDNPLQPPGMDKNPNAGADLVWEATDPEKNPHYKDIADPDSELGQAIDSALEQAKSGNHHGLQSTLAAIAGSATSVFGPVMLEDMHRQLRSIRNRTAQARDRERVIMHEEKEDLGKAGVYIHAYPEIKLPPRSNFWVSAEGNYDRLSADRYAPGYTLNNWGGTLGAETDLRAERNRHASVGLALTAMYGRLRVDSSDSARGHMDTSYVTAFACMAEGRWNHTLIASAGLASMDLARTVSHTAGSYRTKGESEGYTLGALYEVSYTFLVSEESSWVLQPVVNAEYRFVHLNGYTETGSDAGLHVGRTSQGLATFGMGLRARAALGETVCNRSAYVEMRALAKADVGERAGRVSNALISSTARREEVKSARKGAVGVELGAGVTIPLSEFTSIFFDASLELRAHYGNVDANIGFRVNF